jgi:hypothetical protein
MLTERYLTDAIAEDLSEKMVFLSGPRQVGKTTLARTLVGKRFREALSLNWDHQGERKQILRAIWPATADLVILDEIHKYPRWKSWIKGEHDVHHDRFRFLVTGSARLDLYRRKGDSLQGRYHGYRLHPFSLPEMEGLRAPPKPWGEPVFPAKASAEPLELLGRFGGFPEPLLRQNARTLRRWHRERSERLFREDIRDVELIRDLQTLRLLAELLPARVGSLLSLNALREDLQVNHRTVKHWMEVLESFYYCYRIYPFQKSRIRAIRKEPKLYLWDWSEVPEEAARFENLVASHLFKMAQYLCDHDGYRAELMFFRDLNQREVDFVLTVDGKPWIAAETKLSGSHPAPGLPALGRAIGAPWVYQVVKEEGVDLLADGVRIMSASKFLRAWV